MATLKDTDFLKAGVVPTAASGPYKGKTRLQIIKLKIKNGKPFALGVDGKGGTIYAKSVIGKKWPFELLYSKTKGGKKYERIKVNKLFKGPDFGGGGGSGGGAEDTAVTESLQCYYTSVLFNGTDKDWKSLADGIDAKILKKYEKYCDANVSLALCLKSVQSKPKLKSWIDTDPNVFVKTAEAIESHRYAGGMTSPVYFHRGSDFMKAIYARRKNCMHHDKVLTEETTGRKMIAPASFSDDKWNPGDIWMSTLPKNAKDPFPAKEWEGALGTHTCDWSALKHVVGSVAESKQTIGVSLKKVTGTTGEVKEFNLPEREQNVTVKYLGFTFGQTGNFFDSADIYIYFSTSPGGPQSIQCRAFDSVKSWQGEIKGAAAAGGKIGGGGLNYYVEKYFKYSIGHTGLSGKWSEKTNPDWNDAFTLYKTYNEKQLKSKLKKGNKVPTTIKTKATFTKDANAYINNQGKNTPAAFKFGKYMGLLLIDAIHNGANKKSKGSSWATDTFRYASSNIDISSFFIKVY